MTLASLMSMRVALVSCALMMSGCSGGDSADDVAPEETADEEATVFDRLADDTTTSAANNRISPTSELPLSPAEDPETVVTVRGTAERPTPEGYVRTPGGCQRSSTEVSTTGPASLAVPSSWIPGTGPATGPPSTHGGIGYTVAGRWGGFSVEVNLLEPGLTPGTPNSADQPWVSVGGRPVGTIEWAGESIDVTLGDGTYTVLLPALSIETAGVHRYAGPEGQYLLAVSVGGFDEADQAPPEVLTILASTQVDPCLADDYYFENFGNYTLHVED